MLRFFLFPSAIARARTLPQYSSVLMGECPENTVDHLFHIFVRQSLLVVLECKADCVLLLAGRYFVPTVDIEKDYLAQELLLGSKRRIADVGK